MAILTHPVSLTDQGLPRYQGYISVAPNGRYFQDENARGFLVIGQNDATPWPGLVELLTGESPDTVEQYIIDLRAHGVTVSRIMLEYAQEPFTYLENSVGVFNPNVVRFWDQFIHLAEKHGLYLLLTPYDTFWQAERWEPYPYRADGYCNEKHDWLTARAAIDAQKARWDFVIRRWGNSPAIFAWDVMNEIDLWWDSTPDEIEAYLNEMLPFVRRLEQDVWGQTHLLTVSSSRSMPYGKLGELIYNHPAIDFANTHLYVRDGVRKPTDPIACVPEIIEGVEYAIHMLSTKRPYFDSETGPVYGWIKDKACDIKYHHNLTWAHLMTGAAGSGMRWPYTQPHWILPEMRDNLLGLARFSTAVDWAAFDSAPVGSRLTVDADCIISTGCADSQLAILWLLRDTRQADASTLSWLEVTLEHTLDDGEYVVELWETKEGYILTTLMAYVHEGQFVLRLPFMGDLDDVALIVRKVD